MNLIPKGLKVIVEVNEAKQNKEDITKAGIIVAARESDSGDNALLYGKVIKVGTPEVSDNGNVVYPDLEVDTQVWFNRYNSFKIVSRGISTYWVVPCREVYCVGTIDQ